MKRQKFLLIIYFLVAAFAFSSCQKEATENNQDIIQTTPTDSPTTNLSPTPEPNLNSPIRKVDFKNFTYLGIEDYPGNFILKNGEKPFKYGKEDGIYLGKTEFSDLTNDGEEEAILVMSIQTGGSSMPNLIYIYTLLNNKPKFLWGFMTGDRVEGGLKNVYADNGELIVETFGDNKFENDKWTFSFPNKNKFSGYCCPTAYTKIRFKWNGKKFVAQDKPELFDYDFKKEQEKIQHSH